MLHVVHNIGIMLQHNRTLAVTNSCFHYGITNQNSKNISMLSSTAEVIVKVKHKKSCKSEDNLLGQLQLILGSDNHKKTQWDSGGIGKLLSAQQNFKWTPVRQQLMQDICQ